MADYICAKCFEPFQTGCLGERGGRVLLADGKTWQPRCGWCIGEPREPDPMDLVKERAERALALALEQPCPRPS